MITAETERPHEGWVRLCHHLSGGSPLLLSALLEDFKSRDMKIPQPEWSSPTNSECTVRQ